MALPPSLRKVFADGYKQIKTGFGDVPIDMTYLKVTSLGYDTTTGMETESVTQYPFNDFFFKNKATKNNVQEYGTDGSIKITTVETYVNIEAALLDFVPVLGDRILANGETWEITQVSTNSVGSYHKVNLRLYEGA